MDKAIFIINGTGGAGKDTVCEMAAVHCSVRNVSSITPIVEIARFAGWDGVKTKEARRLLSRLKEAFTEYNDLSYQYCLRQAREFLNGDERLRQALGPDCHTLLVRRPSVSGNALGNRSDDEVEQYHYDTVIENDGSLEALRHKVESFLRNWGIAS